MADERNDVPAGKQGPREHQYVSTGEVPTFYANNVLITVTPWDMRLRFTQIEGVSENKSVYREIANVFLSPGQARAVTKLLRDKMEQYEAIWSRQQQIIDSLGEE